VEITASCLLRLARYARRSCSRLSGELPLQIDVLPSLVHHRSITPWDFPKRSDSRPSPLSGRHVLTPVHDPHTDPSHTCSHLRVYLHFEIVTKV
jgi:hypothetical protein